MARMLKADNPVDPTGRQYHLHTKPGDLAPHCLFVGAPERAAHIATTCFTNPKKEGDYRGFESWTGEYEGVPMSVVSHGIGGASIGTVLPEAVASGARRIIRVGSCGALQPKAKIGDAVIVYAAARLDGASDNWAPASFPAVAHPFVVQTLVEVAQAMKVRYHLGIGASTACFNQGQARRRTAKTWLPPRLEAQHVELQRAGILCYDMENSALFTWCATQGVPMVGSVCAVYASRRVSGKLRSGAGEDEAIKIGLKAMHALATKYPL